MLSTRYKSKLSERLSYPVGMELLSHELGKYPGLPEIEVSFWDCPMGSRAEFLDVVEHRRPHEILRATYSRWEKSISIGKDRLYQKYLRGLWTLDVFPVERRLKSEAREELVAAGLPLVAKWLIKPRDPLWYHGYQGCLIEFHPEMGTIQFRDSPRSRVGSRGRKFRAPIK